MTTPAEPAARALQRIRNLHVAGPDGLCADCKQTWPCNTTKAADGPPDSPLDNAINRVRTAITAAESQKPASFAEFRTLVRAALDGTTTAATPTVQP